MNFIPPNEAARMSAVKRYDILDLGLSSETVSGLSEPGHAGGAFPRPCLKERLERDGESALGGSKWRGLVDRGGGIEITAGKQHFQRIHPAGKHVRQRSSRSAQ